MVQKNSRQIPSHIKYTGNKKYSDLLYGYLQSQSLLDRETKARYIMKRDIVFTKIAAELGLSRQTVSTKFKELESMGLVTLNEKEERYDLGNLGKEEAILLPCKTIVALCQVKKDRVLSLLAYLLKSYWEHGKQPFMAPLSAMKEQVGLSVANKNYNDKLIIDYFNILQNLGLIKFHKGPKPPWGAYFVDAVKASISN